MSDTEASITEGFTHVSNSVSRQKHKKKKNYTSDHNHHLHWGDEKCTQIQPICFTSILKMYFFVNPHETYIFRVVKLLMLAQSFLLSFELESGTERGKKKETKTAL